MKFHQAYLQERLLAYLKMNQQVIIFASEKEQPYLEKRLLELSEHQAFFHIQVTTMKHYILKQLKKHCIFDVQPLTKVQKLLAVKASLKIADLHYFDSQKADAGLLESLCAAYEKMADIDLDQQVSMQGTAQNKWQDLKRMYAAFKEAKGKSLSDAELYLLGCKYIDKQVYYAALGQDKDSRTQKLFLEACQAEILDEANVQPNQNWQIDLDCYYHQTQAKRIADFPVDLYEVQFKHQEIDLILQEIEKRLKQGARYQDFIIYGPDMDFIEAVVRKCAFPCRYEISETAQRDLAFLKHLWMYLSEPETAKIEDVIYLSGLSLDAGKTWLERFQTAGTSKRLLLLSEIVDDKLLSQMAELPENLSLEDFVLLAPMLLENETLVMSNGIDCIELTTYQQPILSKTFQTALMCELNEDIYPSKISDKGFILNDELQKYYPNGTPLDHQNDIEWERVKKILVTASHTIVTCHFGSLSGEDVLPSLLFWHLKQLKGISQTPAYSFWQRPVTDDAILEKLEANHHQPQALSQAFSLQFYQKNGRLQISPSELESFNQCPFKHYLSYGLKLYPKKSDMRTSARFGTLMHNLLDACAPLFRLDFEKQLSLLEHQYHLLAVHSLDDRLENLVQALLAKEDFVCESAEEKYLYRQFQNQFLNTLKMLLYHIQEGQFELTYHELPVVQQEDWVTYVGRIDRADIYQDYIKILDYKSSNKSLDLGLSMQGFNIQMLVYLELLAKQKHLTKGAVLYFNTSAKKLAAEGRMNLDGTNYLDYVKAYQMEGWILEDDNHEVMQALDRNYLDSKICHIRYIKSKDAYSGQLLPAASWQRLMEKIFALMHQKAEECFYQGDIRIYPAGSPESALRMKVSPCRFCDYHQVCLKDAFYHEEREIIAYNKEEVKALLEGGEEDEFSHITE